MEGEMWSAALFTSAFTAPNALKSIAESLHHIPPQRRLAEALTNVVGWYTEGVSWEEAMERIDARYGHYH
jgi:hypothetical protein